MDSIIFDVDGTLWDSVDPVAESWNLALAENTDMTPDLTRDSLAWLFGKTMTEIADHFFPRFHSTKECDSLRSALIMKTDISKLTRGKCMMVLLIRSENFPSDIHSSLSVIVSVDILKS